MYSCTKFSSFEVIQILERNLSKKNLNRKRNWKNKNAKIVIGTQQCTLVLNFS